MKEIGKTRVTNTKRLWNLYKDMQTFSKKDSILFLHQEVSDLENEKLEKFEINSCKCSKFKMPSNEIKNKVHEAAVLNVSDFSPFSCILGIN